MKVPRDQIIPRKLAEFAKEQRAYTLKQFKGGTSGALRLIVGAKEAYVNAGLVTRDVVEKYLDLEIGKLSDSEVALVTRRKSRSTRKKAAQEQITLFGESE